MTTPAFIKRARYAAPPKKVWRKALVLHATLFLLGSVVWALNAESAALLFAARVAAVLACLAGGVFFIYALYGYVKLCTQVTRGRRGIR